MVENMSGYEIHRARISCAFRYPFPVNTGSVMLRRNRRDVVDWALPLPLNGSGQRRVRRGAQARDSGSEHRHCSLHRQSVSRSAPLSTRFPHAALGICYFRGLPTQRRRQSDPSGTSPTQKPRCEDASSSRSPGPFRDALAAIRRSAGRQEFPITDAVRLGGPR
jgi:hypothetical protein